MTSQGNPTGFASPKMQLNTEFFGSLRPRRHYCIIYINYQRTLEETGKRGQETYYLKSCLQLSCCLAFYRLLECTGIKVCLITCFLVKPSSSRTLLVQTPQLTFVSRNRIPAISLHVEAKKIVAFRHQSSSYSVHWLYSFC